MSDMKQFLTPPSGTASGSGNPFAPREYGRLEKVTERVWIFRNITNSSFVIGDRSVAVIDTQVDVPTAERFYRLLRSVTDKPVEFVINTHYHWDHTNGNSLFATDGATVVSSERTRQYMIDRAPRQKEFLSGRGFELGEDPLLPHRTFEGDIRLDLGNMPLRLFFAGSAETDDATAVHVEKERVIMSGDTVMTGSFPIFGQPVWDEGLQGDGLWQKTIASLTAMRPDVIVPGHGPLAYGPEIEKLLRIQDYFTEEVRALIKKGIDLEAILSDLEPRLPSWITEIPLVWGTPRYAILRVWRGLTRRDADAEPGWQRFKPSAVPQPPPGSLKKFSDKKGLNEYLEAASEAAEGGDMALRIAVLREASRRFPKEPDAYAACADALIESSRAEASVLEKGDYFAEARACWEKALAVDPSHVPSLLGKGRYLVMMAYRGGDDPKPGMAALEKVMSLAAAGRERAEAEFYFGMGCRRLGDETGARGRFGKALSYDPSFMPARIAGQVS